MGVIMTAFAGWILRVVMTAGLAALAAMFGDVVLSGVGKVLDLLVGAVNSTNLTSMPTVSGALQALPPEMLTIMKRVQLDTCLSIIGTAYSVRFAGNLYGVVKGLKSS